MGSAQWGPCQCRAGKAGTARPADTVAASGPDGSARRARSNAPRLRSGLWPGEDRLETASSSARTLGVAKDQPIYAEGDPAEFCYRVLGGCVRMVKLMDDGRRQVTEFLLPGDMLGLDTLDAYDLTAEAVMPTTLRRYRRAAVEALADRDPAVARRLRSFAANSLRQARERMMLLGRKTATERIASFLLEMTDHASSCRRDHVPLPMGRGDIADHLGLTTETVCRVLTLPARGRDHQRQPAPGRRGRFDPRSGEFARAGRRGAVPRARGAARGRRGRRAEADGRVRRRLSGFRS